MQSPFTSVRKGLNITGGLYLHQIIWHENNNNKATKAQEKYELIRSLSVLYQAKNGMTPVCTWVQATLAEKPELLKDVQETTPLLFGGCL